MVIVVDQPADSVGAKQKAWLHQLQQKHLNKVRVRFHEENMGASAARNRALQVPAQPLCSTVAAAVFARKGHEAAAFAPMS